MYAQRRPAIRLALSAALAVGIALAVAAGSDRASAGGADSAAVRGYIVPTPNNPDVNPATTCASTFAANDQADTQEQSAAGTADNAVTLAGCSYDATPFGGPSTENRPVAFEIDSGPGGLLCAPGAAPAQTCAYAGLTDPAIGEYRVLVNNQAGVDPTGSMRVTFCADDPPVTGACGAEDEQGTAYTIAWRARGGGAGGGGGKCAGRPVTIVATSKTTKGTPGDDVIAGRPGVDKIKAKGGKDRICSGGGKDKPNGGGGKDLIKGGGGKDRIAGAGGRDKLKGGGGADSLNGGPGKDKCNGGPGKDKLASCERGKA